MWLMINDSEMRKGKQESLEHTKTADDNNQEIHHLEEDFLEGEMYDGEFWIKVIKVPLYRKYISFIILIGGWNFSISVRGSYAYLVVTGKLTCSCSSLTN